MIPYGPGSWILDRAATQYCPPGGSSDNAASTGVAPLPPVPAGDACGLPSRSAAPVAEHLAPPGPARPRSGSGVPGFRGSRVPGFRGSGVPGFRGSGVPGFQGSRVPGFQGSGVPGFQGSGVPGFRGSGPHFQFWRSLLAKMV